ncbi:MAG TPA: hypothetical protein VD948_06625 [Rhodothermales bacterium]|nr:hypothetical protein [Rhodothermales bacterium]
MQRRLNRHLARLGMRLSSQNLNERRGGGKGPMWRHGRAWLWLRQDERGGNPVIGLEWRFGAKRLGLRLTVDGQHGDDDFTLAVNLPGLSFYVTGDGLVPRTWKRGLPNDPHSIGVSWHDGGLWWDCWQNDHEWRRGTPRWRHGHFTPMDALFGRTDHRRELLGTHPVEVPMPERAYPGTVTLFESVWTRRRWPHWPLTRRMVRAEVDVPGGVPHPGKGENSWDCGEDATYSLTCAESTVEGAVSRLVESVMRSRRKYGGPNWRPAEKVVA